MLAIETVRHSSENSWEHFWFWLIKRDVNHRVRQWTMSSWYGLVGNCTVRYCSGGGFEKCWINPRLPQVRSVDHEHDGRNAVTATLSTIMGRTRLYLSIQIWTYLGRWTHLDITINNSMYRNSLIPWPLISEPDLLLFFHHLTKLKSINPNYRMRTKSLVQLSLPWKRIRHSHQFEHTIGSHWSSHLELWEKSFPSL